VAPAAALLPALLLPGRTRSVLWVGKPHLRLSDGMSYVTGHTLLFRGRREHQLEQDGTLEFVDGVHDHPAVVPRLGPPLGFDASGGVHGDAQVRFAKLAFPYGPRTRFQSHPKGFGTRDVSPEGAYQVALLVRQQKE